jgi:hypothetical protein
MTKDDNHQTCMVGGSLVLNFQYLGLLLRDAQWLKFNHPALHWAPDLKDCNICIPLPICELAYPLHANDHNSKNIHNNIIVCDHHPWNNFGSS